MPSSPQSSPPSVAAHARYSSDLQRQVAVADRLRVREKQGRLVAERYADQPISTTSLIRPASQRARPFTTLASH